MIIEQMRSRFGANFAYVVAYGEGMDGAVIDPSGMAGRILRFVESKEIDIRYIFNTHTHPDHTGGNAEIAERTKAKIVRHSSSASSNDISVGDGDIMMIGKLEARIIHTPGHTPDSISILISSNLFTGDTLFINECGRTDLPGGSSEELWNSLFNKILKLDDGVEIWPGHDYGPIPHDLLGNQKKSNYTLQPRTREEFVQFMLEP